MVGHKKTESPGRTESSNLVSFETDCRYYLIGAILSSCPDDQGLMFTQARTIAFSQSLHRAVLGRTGNHGRYIARSSL
jgi:hypothetical protein